MSIYPECSAWRHLFAYRGLLQGGKTVLNEMFTSQARIDRKTGPDDLGRFGYLQAPVSDICRLQIADCRLQTADCRLQIAD